jgi:dTMP kinase
MEKAKGKFIVIDGTDGSGKATQTELLASRLRTAGLEVEIADFPQYNTKSAGLVEEYLSGKYGSPEEVGPYRASIFYAVDRYDASFKIRKWLDDGKIVISNRYVTANMGHQGGKINNPLERKHYFEWLDKLEYGLFNIPRPDLNIILYVPAEISQQLALGRDKLDWAGKTRDIHQESLDHLKKAERSYLEIAKSFPSFALIECTQNGQMRSREENAHSIWREVSRLIGLPHIQHAPDFKVLHDKHEAERKEKFKLRVERLTPHAKLPMRSHSTDAGLDLFSADYYSFLPNERILVQTGIKLAIPEGYVGLIWDKSGVAKDGIHTLAGVIDAGFRGEIKVTLVNLSQDIYHIAPGQKIAQLIIQRIELPNISEEMIGDITDRGEGGFGSTGLY